MASYTVTCLPWKAICQATCEPMVPAPAVVILVKVMSPPRVRRDYDPRVYHLHLVPVRASVGWLPTFAPMSARISALTCSVFLERHGNEETPAFAAETSPANRPRERSVRACRLVDQRSHLNGPGHTSRRTSTRAR